MGEVSKEGRTILFVSHNMAAISSLCNKTIVLDGGTINYVGDTYQAIQRYMQPNSQHVLHKLNFSGPLKSDILFHKIRINGQEGTGISISPKEEILFEVEGEAQKEQEGIIMDLAVVQNGIVILKVCDVQKEQKLEKGRFCFSMKIQSYLLRPGVYSVSIGGRLGMNDDWVHGSQVCDFIVKEEWDNMNLQGNIGIINVPFSGERTKL